MIEDPTLWKDDLLRVAQFLETAKDQHLLAPDTYYLVEREVMASAYAVRKLADSRKLSNELAERQVAVTRHAHLGERIDLIGRSSFEEYYDLENGMDVQISFREVCNQIVHSWIWHLSATVGGGFNGIHVASERDCKKWVYFLSADLLISNFRDVGSEFIICSRLVIGNNGELLRDRRIAGEPPAMCPPQCGTMDPLSCPL